MSDGLGSLTQEDVQRVALLIESLSQSTFDFLQLEIGDLKVTIGKGDVVPGPSSAAHPAAAAHTTPSAAAEPAAPAASPAASPVRPASPGGAAAGGQGDTVAITSPILGIFYAQSQPGAPPFVTLGSAVTEDTTVALVEVMKVFTAVCAGVQGVVTEICVQDGQLVEYGQVLFRIRPK